MNLDIPKYIILRLFNKPVRIGRFVRALLPSFVTSFGALISAVIFFTCSYTSTAWSAKKDLDVSGDISYDVTSYSGDLFSDEDAVNDRVNGLRRFKLSAKYKFSDVLSSKLSLKYELDEDKFVVDDAYFNVDLGSHVVMTLGKFKEPFGMENQQSLKTQYLLERSVATNAFTFDRNNGVKFLTYGKWWRWDLAAMKIVTEDNDFDDSIAYVTRFTVSPINKKKYFLHLGAGYSTRGAVDEHKINGKLIAHGVGNLIEDKKIDGADTIVSGNLEFAAGYGPVVLQSELFQRQIKSVESDGSSKTHNRAGYYTTFLWTMMGRNREYDDGEVVFAKAKKQTLELALRYGVIDLESEWNGDVAKVASIAVNYYIRTAFKVSLEYAYADLISYDVDKNGSLNPLEWGYENPNVNGSAVSARLQFML